MILLPDEKQADVWEAEIRDGIAPGNLLMFAHGFSVHFGQIDPDLEVDVGMVAPKSPDTSCAAVRGGKRRPGLVAIHRDSTGNARDLVLAYAKGIGCTRRRGDRDHLQGRDRDRPVRRAGRALRRRQRAGAGGLRDARRGGYDPRLAYFECLHELKLIVDLMYEKGITGMRYSSTPPSMATPTRGSA